MIHDLLSTGKAASTYSSGLPENCKQQMEYIIVQGTEKNSQAQYSPEIISTREPRSS